MAHADEAMQKPGSRLESCGYGADGKLAVNSGVFLGCRGSPRAGGGAADWMALSGRARGGDSGGPIFDQAGRVVGILWGTDGSEVNWGLSTDVVYQFCRGSAHSAVVLPSHGRFVGAWSIIPFSEYKRKLGDRSVAERGV